MKSLRKVHPQAGLELQDTAQPMPGAGEVLVQVLATGVCGTDLHIDKWTPSYHFMAPTLPVTIGHEFAGVVVQLGEGVTQPAVGQRVTVRPSVTCGRCDACTSGHPDDCTTRRGIGVGRDGAFASHVCAPARNCVPVSPQLSPTVAALAEPLTVSWEAVRTGGVQPGDRVLVLGPGNIGQGIALFAREAGAQHVCVAGHNDRPRLQVLQQLGFEHVLDFSEQPMEAALAEACQNGAFDVVIEATGSAAVIQPALQALKVRGVLVIAGIHAQPVAVDLTALVRKHQQIRGSYRAPEAAWPQVVAFMNRNEALLQHMVTHTVGLSGAVQGFELARNKTATKVMVVPDEVLAEANL